MASETTTDNAEIEAEDAYADLTPELAREYEEDAYQRVAELEEKLRTGVDLSGLERIHTARREAETATMLREGVEARQRAREYQDWVDRVEQFRANAVAERASADEQSASLSQQATTALREYADHLVATNTARRASGSDAQRLASEAAAFDGHQTEGFINSSLKVTREPASVMDALVALLVEVLPDRQTRNSWPHRDRQLAELLVSVARVDGGSIAALMNRLPGDAA